jgi:hypothetical protein
VQVRLAFALRGGVPAAAWAKVRQHIPWLLAEQARIRNAGSFN